MGLLRVLQQFRHPNGHLHAPGDEIEADGYLAEMLVRDGVAEHAPEAAAPSNEPEPAAGSGEAAGDGEAKADESEAKAEDAAASEPEAADSASDDEQTRYRPRIEQATARPGEER